MHGSRWTVLSNDYSFFVIRIIRSGVRLGLRSARVGETLGRGSYGYNSASDIPVVISWIEVLDFR